MTGDPALSVVVVVYNMRREASRTLYSLSPAYQRGIEAGEYEVIVVENGSTEPVGREAVEGLGDSFRYFYMENASPSPAAAVNFGLRQATGAVVGVMIDGARIASPGLLSRALLASRIRQRTVVASLGFYLGHELQRDALTHGYSRVVEDVLLESIHWPADGYRLFEIATPDECSITGWVDTVSESNALFMRANLWAELGGMDERFDLPGGGLVNLDTFDRACELPGADLVVLLGEGTFHQVHGGTATNAPPADYAVRARTWREQYQMLRGRPWAPTFRKRLLFGSFPAPFLRRLVDWSEVPPPRPAPPRAAGHD